MPLEYFGRRHFQLLIYIWCNFWDGGKTNSDIFQTDSSTQDESELLHEWFELVLEKNRLMRYEAELLIM